MIPYERSEFWSQIREIIREEVSKSSDKKMISTTPTETPRLREKPLYEMQEICTLFKITKPTIYDWIRHGKLRRVKIRSRVYFLGSEIKELMQTSRIQIEQRLFGNRIDTIPKILLRRVCMMRITLMM